MANNELILHRERRGLRSLATVLSLTGALALSSCGEISCGVTVDSKENKATQQPSKDTTESSGNTKESPQLVFDDLGGGSPIIRVYPGVKNRPEDRIANGTYNDGDVVGAECKTQGRTVRSHPEVGETERSSNDWIRIDGSPGETQYATSVYIEDPQQLLDQLKTC